MLLHRVVAQQGRTLLHRAVEPLGDGVARQNVQHLHAPKPRITVVRHAATPSLESAGKRWGGQLPQGRGGSREHVRDVYDGPSRINLSLDALRDTMGTAVRVNLRW